MKKKIIGFRNSITGLTISEIIRNMTITNRNIKEAWTIHATELSDRVAVEIILWTQPTFGGKVIKKYHTALGDMKTIMLEATNVFLSSPNISDETKTQLQEVKNEYSQLSLF